MAIITLTTDFGNDDGFVGTMKGVIWSICPEVQLADLSHSIPPQDILAGGRVLERTFTFFPPGTIHLAVIDPGVGTPRRPMAAQIGDYFFVGPDNGLFTPIYDLAEHASWPVKIVQLMNAAYLLPRGSSTFHGRDLFAPTAAYLAKGVSLGEFGPPLRDPIHLALPRPEKTATGWRSHVIGIDTFGNLATDLAASELRHRSSVRVILGQYEVRGLVRTYGERPAGELVALADSSGRLELAVVNGSAAALTGAKVGDEVAVVE